VSHERIKFNERIRVEQQVEPLAGGQLAALMLLIDALFAAAEERLRAHVFESFEFWSCHAGILATLAARS
jgi:hypothetical protein